MPSFEIRWEGAARADREEAASTLGTPVVSTAQDWMEALGEALDRYGLSRSKLATAVCLIRRDGAIDVVDPDSGSRFVVRQLDCDDDAAMTPSLDAVELSAAEDEGLDAPDPAESAAWNKLRSDPGQVLAAVDAALAALPSGLSGDARAQAGLDLLIRHVPAASASVLIETRPGGPVRFAAAHGPASRRLADVTVPAGRGVVGVVLRTGTTLFLREAVRNPDHFDAVDKAVGHRTRAMLACPIQGERRGALQLLNPFGSDDFTPAHGRVARRIARWLGEGT
ncbi:MAG: GAF domain-containing protein [Alphaproteobacteria bacterium]|nr:GAF domain-containing protein [Alphaproteobacteria bacterium]